MNDLEKMVAASMAPDLKDPGWWADVLGDYPEVYPLISRAVATVAATGGVDRASVDAIKQAIEIVKGTEEAVRADVLREELRDRWIEYTIDETLQGGTDA